MKTAAVGAIFVAAAYLGDPHSAILTCLGVLGALMIAGGLWTIALPKW